MRSTSGKLQGRTENKLFVILAECPAGSALQDEKMHSPIFRPPSSIHNEVRKYACPLIGSTGGCRVILVVTQWLECVVESSISSRNQKLMIYCSRSYACHLQPWILLICHADISSIALSLVLSSLSRKMTSTRQLLPALCVVLLAVANAQYTHRGLPYQANVRRNTSSTGASASVSNILDRAIQALGGKGALQSMRSVSSHAVYGSKTCHFTGS